MAFPLVTTESQAGAGSVCFHISRCAFKAAALGAEPFSALFLAAFCILLEEQGWRGAPACWTGPWGIKGALLWVLGQNGLF